MGSSGWRGITSRSRGSEMSIGIIGRPDVKDVEGTA
jgi:hypothetical protein